MFPKGPCAEGWWPVVLWGGGGAFKRWSLLAGSRSHVCSSSLSLLPGHHEVSGFAPYVLPARCTILPRAQNPQSELTMDVKTSEIEPK